MDIAEVVPESSSLESRITESQTNALDTHFWRSAQFQFRYRCSSSRRFSEMLPVSQYRINRAVLIAYIMKRGRVSVEQWNDECLMAEMKYIGFCYSLGGNKLLMIIDGAKGVTEIKRRGCRDIDERIPWWRAPSLKPYHYNRGSEPHSPASEFWNMYGNCRKPSP